MAVVLCGLRLSSWNMLEGIVLVTFSYIRRQETVSGHLEESCVWKFSPLDKFRSPG